MKQIRKIFSCIDYSFLKGTKNIIVINLSHYSEEPEGDQGADSTLTNESAVADDLSHHHHISL